MRSIEARGVPILMYHSISERRGPTAIPPGVFAAQLEALADHGFEALPLSSIVARMRAGEPLPPRSFVLTFDDGYEDFAVHAHGQLAARGYPATVFLPTDKVGGTADWDGPGAGGAADWDGPAAGAPRIMTWETIRELADAGVAFGSHGATHRDLTALPHDELEAELAASKRAIEERLAGPVTSFAMPYGSTSPAVRRQIGKVYACAVGTRLERARSGADLFDLPRLDMWYFRDARRWRRFLEGRAEAWLAARRALRRLRKLAHSGPLRVVGR